MGSGQGLSLVALAAALTLYPACSVNMQGTHAVVRLDATTDFRRLLEDIIYRAFFQAFLTMPDTHPVLYRFAL